MPPALGLALAALAVALASDEPVPVNELPPLRRIPLGRLGPPSRSDLAYYDHLYLLSAYFGGSAKSLLEVGCSDPPFARHLAWIPRRVCVAPYFASYKKTGGGRSATLGRADIEEISADFMTWSLPRERFDLVVCSQVLEHVPEPRAFLQRLLQSGVVVIASVPFQWTDDNAATAARTHHLQHFITAATIREWAAPHAAVVEQIVRAKSSLRRDSGSSRVLFVFVPLAGEDRTLVSKVTIENRTFEKYRVRRVGASARAKKIERIRAAEADMREKRQSVASII